MTVGDNMLPVIVVLDATEFTVSGSLVKILRVMVFRKSVRSNLMQEVWVSRLYGVDELAGGRSLRGER